MATLTQIHDNLRDAAGASAKAQVALLLERVHEAFLEALTSSNALEAMQATLDELQMRKDELAAAVAANLPDPEPTQLPAPAPEPTPTEPPVEPVDAAEPSPAPEPVPEPAPAPEPPPDAGAEPVAETTAAPPPSSGFRGRR
jgi:outer membrane biosynthesis protein TonB